jgi:hypothetical protein
VQGRQLQFLKAGSVEFDGAVSKLAITPSEALDIVKIEIRRRNRLRLPSTFAFEDYYGVVGNYYAILRPVKVGISYRGFYVDGMTGRVAYRDNESPPIVGDVLVP